MPKLTRSLCLLLGFAAAGCGDDDAQGTDAAPDSVDSADSTTPDAADSIDDSAAPDSVDSIDDSTTPDAVDSIEDSAAPDSDTTTARTRFAFEPIEVRGATGVWGAMAVGDLLIGGVDNLSRAQPAIVRATLGADGAIDASAVTELDVPRYCACAALDPTRQQLLVVGGRGTNFGDLTSSVLVDVATGGALTLADDNGPHAFPVGCTAYYAAATDRAYVFGGLSSTQRAFSATTWRWNPDTRLFAALRGDGPPGRYDPALHVLADGDALIVSGMGLDGEGPVFYQDIWRFDAATETWSEIVPTTATRPPGRRYGWSALAPDESVLVFGFGSDSGQGTHMLGDVWTFTFATGVWAPIEVDGALPSARAFAPPWFAGGEEGPVFAFGLDNTMQVLDEAFVLRVPDALRGRWR